MGTQRRELECIKKIIIIIIIVYIAQSMSQDFRGAGSGAMNGAGGRRLDGDDWVGQERHTFTLNKGNDRRINSP